MLDATNIAENIVYRATDAAQVIYRSLLAGYSEEELIRLEDELGIISETGLLPDSIRAILDAGLDIKLAA